MMRTYRLNVDTIQSIDDIKIILDELGLVTTEDSPKFHALKKYFTFEVKNETQCEPCNSNNSGVIMPDLPGSATPDPHLERVVPPVSLNGMPI